MRIEKRVLNDALQVLGKVVCQTSPVELYRSIRFVGDGDGGCAMATDGVETVSVMLEAFTDVESDFCVPFNRECNNSPFVISSWFSWGKTGNKKAVWCVQTALKQKKWWQDPGSNRGHGDFQSPALPTELSRHWQLVTLIVLTVPLI